MKRHIATLAVIALGITGCSDQGKPAVAESARIVTWAMSAETEYTSVAEAAEDATLIVRGVAGPANSFELNGAPFTTTELKVSEVYAGRVDSDSVIVRQFGDEKNVMSDGVRVLLRGQEYVLFLREFWFNPDEPTGEWLIVGDQAAWIVAEGGELDYVGTEKALADVTIGEVATK